MAADDGSAPSSPTSPAAPGPATAAADGTLFGASFQRRPGEGYSEALSRTDRHLALEVVRVYHQGAPAPWSERGLGRDLVVSFKLPPQEVLAGRHDDRMAEWFDEAPRDATVHWVYWHEPEDESEAGAFTPAQFRQAFAHLADLADRSGNPALRATVVLMSYSLDPKSGRSWRDWYPPPDSVDVLAWDVYNRGTGETFYPPAVEFLAPLWAASASVGKPYALAEVASPLAPGDDGSARAAWITAVGCHLIATDAVFATWFDFLWNDGADDYRLLDAPSRSAWRQLARTDDDDVLCRAVPAGGTRVPPPAT